MLRRSFNNLGATDRAVRAILGAVLVAVAVAIPGMTWAWIGALPLATAALGWCPLYSLLGISTAHRAREAR